MNLCWTKGLLLPYASPLTEPLLHNIIQERLLYLNHRNHSSSLYILPCEIFMIMFKINIITHGIYWLKQNRNKVICLRVSCCFVYLSTSNYYVVDERMTVVTCFLHRGVRPWTCCYLWSQRDTSHSSALPVTEHHHSICISYYTWFPLTLNNRRHKPDSQRANGTIQSRETPHQ